MFLQPIFSTVRTRGEQRGKAPFANPTQDVDTDDAENWTRSEDIMYQINNHNNEKAALWQLKVDCVGVVTLSVQQIEPSIKVLPFP